MTTISRTSRLGLAIGGLALLLTACGGGGGGGGGVASLSGATDDTTATTAATDAKATEEQVLAWVQCMREQGLDIADPTVDSDGNLVLGGGPRPGGISGSDTTGTSTARPDRSVFEKATQTCGNPPQTGGGFNEEDRQAMQDQMLAMARCLRDQGLDVADPDFSAQGPGGPPPSDDDSANGTPTQRRGPFGDLDMNDATVQEAFTTCQAELGTTFPGRPGATTTTGGNS